MANGIPITEVWKRPESIAALNITGKKKVKKRRKRGKKREKTAKKRKKDKI